jgi:MYXO-CTERM domain-containing protein
MTRAAAFALWMLILSPVAFAQDATIDSASSDSGADTEYADTTTGGEQGAASLAGELGGCQGCASGEAVGGLGAAALGLLLVGLSRRR